MPRMMRGLILRGPSHVELGERPIPTPGPYEALIKVTAVATCNTDLEIVENVIFPPAVGRFIGHECVGIVEEVGSEVKYFKPGDRIAVPSLTPEWRSIEAQQGWATFSNGGMSFDWCLMRDGVFAEYVCCRDVDMNCGKIPNDVTDLQAIMLADMVSTAWNGLDHTPLHLGDTAVVFGVGPVGLCAIAGVKHKGVSRLFAIGTNPKGVELAKEFGATDIISYKDGDVVQQIIEKNGGRVDVCVMAGGKGKTVSQAFRLTRPGGQICSVNAFYDNIVLTPEDWNSGMETKRFTGYQNTGGREMFERYMKFFQYNKDFDPAKIVTDVTYGIDCLEKTLWAKKRRDCLKPVCILP